MRRVAIGLLAAVALCAAAVGATARSSAQAGTKATKLTVWVGWSSRELGVFKKIVAEYDRNHPEVTVKVVGGIDDSKIVASIRGGNAADVTSSFDSTNVGNYCTSGAWINLKPLLDKDNISLNLFPKTSVYYTSYKGVQCALPLLADTWGLYYNTTLFKKAGLTRPPKTIEELTRYAKKLTQKNANGSLKVVGFNPSRTFYAENSAVNYGHLFGAKWLTPDGKSNLAKDPAWAKYLRWSKSLIDWYGADKLKRWQAKVGDEFSSSNAFETGKLAMQIDGEWRVAFIAAEHPELKYATAPMAVDGAHKNLYGSNNVNGTIIGIPKTTKHKDEAWALVKYLTTNSHPLAQFSNGIRNVPTTKASLTSKEIKPDKHFATFLKIFANPKNTTFPITAVGSAFGTFFNNFIDKYQAGHANDLSGGLKKVDKDTDAQLKQGGGGVP
jgi:ABC-type glycerol-3-phosphate transport system substrate-binding protein